jgi:hypothetical protein
LFYDKPIKSSQKELQGLRTNKEMNLQIAIKVVNNIVKLDRLVLILLVFGSYPWIVATNSFALSIS